MSREVPDPAKYGISPERAAELDQDWNIKIGTCAICGYSEGGPGVLLHIGGPTPAILENILVDMGVSRPRASVLVAERMMAHRKDARRFRRGKRLRRGCMLVTSVCARCGAELGLHPEQAEQLPNQT